MKENAFAEKLDKTGISFIMVLLKSVDGEK